MAKLYAMLIKKGQMTIERVPERWKDEVIALLEV